MVRNLTSVFKLIFAILFLPLTIYSSINFFMQLNNVNKTIFDYFLWGIFSYLILHLFIYAPEIVYRKGQGIVSGIFKFFSPLVKVAPFFLPIYTIFLLLIFSLINSFFKDINISKELTFIISFTLTFHMVFTAGVFKTKENDILRATYFFSMQLIYLVNVFIVGFCFGYFFENFSFIDFYNNTLQQATDIYKFVFTQFFVVKS